MTRSNRALVHALAVALSAGACSSAGDDDPGVRGGQTGSESFGCLADSAVPLEPDEVSAIGLSASDVLSRFAAYEQGGLRYAATGERVDYTLVLEQSEPARFEERVWKSDGSGVELAISCEDALVVPVTIALDTDDSAFAERWTGIVTASASGFISLNARANVDALAGSYAPSASDTAGAARVNVLFNVTLLGPTFLGTLSMQIEQKSSAGVASAHEVPIATFPAAAE